MAEKITLRKYHRVFNKFKITRLALKIERNFESRTSPLIYPFAKAKSYISCTILNVREDTEYSKDTKSPYHM